MRFWWIVVKNNHATVTSTTTSAPPVNSFTMIPYQSQSEAQSQAAKLNAPGSDISKIRKNIIDPVGNIPNDIFKGLNLSNILLRVGEILLGLVLLGVGIAHMTGTENVLSNAAKTAGKAAMFA
jgi:hypothetical protein